jgi:plastocyanin
MRRRSIGGSLVALSLATAWMWPTTAAMAGGGCHTGATQGEGENVEMAKACFSPSVLRVDPGTEVTFVNLDPITHNVSASGWGTDQDLERGDRFTATFADEGTFPYACMYHYGMTGAIVVGDGNGPATGQPVEVSSVSTFEELPKQPAASVTSTSDEGSAAPGLALAAGIGLVAGVGTSALIRRRKREI